jgi:hypothetical protein
VAEGQGDGRRALFSFLHRRMHGTWGDPVIEQAALEPQRSRHYLASGVRQATSRRVQLWLAAWACSSRWVLPLQCGGSLRCTCQAPSSSLDC